LAYAQRQPVFALLSGVSEGEWAPVHAFCEQQKVPCWLPTVDLPVEGASDFYSVYFSRGVILEAEVLAHYLGERHTRRVIEVRTDDVAAAGAAQALRRALGVGDVAIEERVLGRVDAAALREAAASTTASDAVVWWLRGPDVARLAELAPPRADVYFSTTLAEGAPGALPRAWKAQAMVVYPFELPARRRFDHGRFLAWLQTRGLALVDERIQAEAYLACVLMAEKVDEMLEDLYRDSLLERAEAILSPRVGTAMYPRLSLGPGQRFASKGGYVARFAAAGDSLVAETDWIVP
jgi:hypothetical protein